VIALVLALAATPRLYTAPDLHLGARIHVLASPGEVGGAVTVQLTI
jgi:hypothetical protein